MSWMFRWLDQLLSHLRRENSEHHAFERGWVEPSNAITRAILSGAVAQLAISAPVAEPVVAQATPAPPAAPQPAATAVEQTLVLEASDEILEAPEPSRAAPGIVTRTAQRARRRRANRAA